MVHTLITGSYTDSAPGPAIRLFRFDDANASFAPLSESRESVNASFLYIGQDRLLAVNEQKEHGHLDLYAVRQGALALLDRLFVEGADLCHIHRWKGTDFYSAANYSSGDFVIFSAGNDRLRLIQQVRHHGIGFDAAGRQEGPHVHSTLLSPDGRILYVADLGLDSVFAYETRADGTVCALPEYRLSFPAGQGPRHMAFSPDGAYFFAVTELGSRLYVFSNKKGGPMRPLCDSSILPEGFAGENLAADLHVSPDGRFVYASNRGADTIAAFRFSGPDDTAAGRIPDADDTAVHRVPGADAAGCFSVLTPIGQYAVHGNGPRNFCLSRDGSWLFAACQHTGNLSVFRRNPADGTLAFVRNDRKIPGCVFIGEL